MNNKALIDAMRAILPYAVERADELRARAGDAAQRWPAGAGAEYAAQLATRAEAATHAVTDARLALQDAEAAAHHLSCHVAYEVTLRVDSAGRWWTHNVRLLAECADDAQAAAIAACEAACLIHGDVLHVRRVVA